MDELLNLTDDELNARAARALGWEEIAGSQGQRLWRNGDKVMPKDAWIPASNLNQAFRLQDEVSRRDLRNEFTDALVSLGSAAFWNWRIANASARQRTIAAVYVLDGTK